MKKLLGFFVVIIPIIAILVVVLTSTVVGATVEIPVASIELKTTAGAVAVNTSHTMEYEIYPKQAKNKSVLFDSSDESVATVNQEGIVSFVGFGTVHITVTTVDGAKSGTCEFNVVSDNPFGINLTVDSPEIAVGETARLYATIFPASALDKGVTFTSLDEDVATVDANGVVTALACGDVTIAANTNDGNISQSITLSVIKKATSISLSVDDVFDDVVCENEFVTVGTSFLPADTSEKYQALYYSSSDTAIATVARDGKVTFKKSGTVSITAATSYGIRDTIRLFYTGGLPSSFTCLIDGTVEKTFDETQFSNNCGLIPLEYSQDSTKHVASFSTSNPDVVTVDEYGSYTIRGGGFATVTITVETANVENGVLTVGTSVKTVDFEITRMPTSISAPASAFTSAATFTLRASALPVDATNKTLTYESLDASVASVNADGVITFKKAGTARIKIATQNGVEKICSITSSLGYPSDCVINARSSYLQVGQATPLTLTFNPLNSAEKSGVWSVVDESAATVGASGAVTPLKEGAFTVKFTYDAWDAESGAVVEKTTSITLTGYETLDYANLILPDGLPKYDSGYITSKSKLTLGAAYAPVSAAAEVRYFSTDTSVAAVDAHGNVYFKKTGTAGFYAKCTGIHDEAQSEIVYIEYSGVSPKDVTLNVPADALWRGEWFDVTAIAASVIPSDCTDVSFVLSETGNSFIINGNRIIASTPGTSTITATFANGLHKSFTATVKQHVTGIELSSNLPDGNVTFKTTAELSARVTPATAFNKGVTYASDDESVATVDADGVVTFKKAGTVVVTATAADGRGATADITLRSTFGQIEAIYIEDETILSGYPLTYTYFPVDATGVTATATVISQSPEAGTDDVLTTDGNRLIGNNAGTAVVNVSTSAPNEVQNNGVTVTVEFVNCTITNFTVADITLYEGETAEIVISDILPVDTDELYIKYMQVQYDAHSSLTFADDTVTASAYGVYTVTATFDEAVVEFTVTVKTKEIVIDNISDENVLQSAQLSKVTEEFGGENADVIVTGENVVELGMPRLNTSAPNPAYDVEFTYSSGDESVATVDDNGKVTFKKAGVVTINVHQTVTLAGGGAASDGGKAAATVTESDMQVVLHYYDTTQSYDVLPLNKETVNTFTYSATDAAANIITPSFQNFFPKLQAFTLSDATFEIVENVPVVSGQNVLEITTDKKIKLLHGGTAKINITVGGKTYQYDIKVTRLVDTVTAQADVLTASDAISLSAPAMYPSDASNKNYYFVSSDTTVATVAANLLTFIKAGEVTVTVKSSDGNAFDTFTVKSTFGGIDGFELENALATINKSETYLLTPVVTPAGGTTTFSFAITSNSPTGGGSDDVASVSESGLLTALCGGSATVTVSATNAFNEVLTRTFALTVVELPESLEIAEPSLTDTDNGNYITAQNSLTLAATVGGIHATDKTILWASSAPTVATVDANGKISFLTAGVVTITASCKANPEVTDSVSFRYTQNAALSATLQAFADTITVGDTLSFTAATVVPSNVSLQYAVTILSQTANNGVGGNVITVSNGVITAVSGGTATYEIRVNGFKVGDTHTLTVLSPLTSVTVDEAYYHDEKTEIQITYRIDASPVPAHTHERLCYTVLSGEGVTVDENGLVTLTGFTTAVIRVSGNESTNVYRDVTITYVERPIPTGITIAAISGGVLFGGQNYTLSVSAVYPSSTEVVPNAQVTFSSLTPTLCSVSNAGVVTALSNVYGEAQISASYADKNTVLTFVVAPVVNLSFELNSAGDRLGIKSERVFGTKSFNSSAPSSLTDTTPYYQMTFSSLTQTYGAPLTWESSDDTIATVDGNGVVNRLKAGSVTITCTPTYRYGTEQAAYTFKLVSGVDVYNIAQYEVYTAWLSQYADSQSSASTTTPVVLHSDIIYTSSYGPNFWSDSAVTEGYRSFRGISNLYGNGHTIDASAANHGSYSSPIAFHIVQNNVLIDNVTLVGEAFSSSSNLSDLSEASITLGIRNNSRVGISNIVIANSVIMNGKSNINSYGAQFTLTGCLVKNAYEGNILLNTFADSGRPVYSSDATLKNCAVENSLMPSIDLKVDKENIPAESSNVLTVSGDIYINNWRNKSQIPNDETYGKQLRKAFDELLDAIPTLAKDGYVNFGISRLSADGLAKDYINYGTVTGNPSYLQTATINTTYAAIYKIEMKLDTYYGNAIPTLPGADLTPGHTLSSSIYPYIRDVTV